MYYMRVSGVTGQRETRDGGGWGGDGSMHMMATASEKKVGDAFLPTMTAFSTSSAELCWYVLALPLSSIILNDDGAI